MLCFYTYCMAVKIISVTLQFAKFRILRPTLKVNVKNIMSCFPVIFFGCLFFKFFVSVFVLFFFVFSRLVCKSTRFVEARQRCYPCFSKYSTSELFLDSREITFNSQQGKDRLEAKILPMDSFLVGPITCCLITFLSHEISRRLGCQRYFCVAPRQKVHLWFLIPHVTIIPENISVPGTGDLVSTTYFSSKSKKAPSPFVQTPLSKLR